MGKWTGKRTDSWQKVWDSVEGIGKMIKGRKPAKRAFYQRDGDGLKLAAPLKGKEGVMIDRGETSANLKVGERDMQIHNATRESIEKLGDYIRKTNKKRKT